MVSETLVEFEFFTVPGQELFVGVLNKTKAPLLIFLSLPDLGTKMKRIRRLQISHFLVYGRLPNCI
jgi:hypothetical protein